jgi:hypothetical protein
MQRQITFVQKLKNTSISTEVGFPTVHMLLLSGGLEDMGGYLILLHMLLNVLIDPPPPNHQNCSQQLQITKFRFGLYLFLICFTEIKEKTAKFNKIFTTWNGWIYSTVEAQKLSTRSN